jgi:hypothetical protein
MLKANNLGDVVSVASARANLEVMSRGDCLGRDVSQAAGGVLFDGKTSSSCRLYSALGAAGSIGTGELSLWLRLRMPQAAASGGPLLGWVGPSNASDGSAGSFSLYYSTGTSLYVRLFTAAGSPNDQIIRTLTNLRSTYEGQVVDLLLVRSAVGLTVYVNGAEWTAYSDSASGSGAWTNTVTSTYLCLGPASDLAAVQAYYRCVLFNIALAASEVSEIQTVGIPYRFKWATNVAATSSGIPYASDFSSGANGWTCYNVGTVTGDNDGIGGENDNLRYLDNGANGSHIALKASFLIPGKSYRFTGKIYIPSSNGTLAEVRPYLDNSQIVDPITTKDAWVAWSGVATSDGTKLQMRGQNSAHTATYTGTSGDAFYAREITVGPRGAIADLDLAVGAGVQIPDRSANGLHAGQGYTSGWEHKLRKANGEFLFVKTLAHADISATGETTGLFTLLANCGILDVEFDRETAFDGGTTLDIGITGNNTKYVNAANVAATGKLLVDSGSKGSESATAPNTIYIKKNQATTQGQTTIRVRCVMRG